MHIYLFMYIYICMCIYLFTFIYIYTYIYTHTHTRAQNHLQGTALRKLHHFKAAPAAYTLADIPKSQLYSDLA